MDERLKVLKLLEEGKINAEEAERLLRALSKQDKKEKMKIYNIDDFLDGLEKLIINVNAGSLEIRKSEKCLLERNGMVDFEKEGSTGYIDVNGGVCEIEMNKDIPIELNLNFGNCEVEIANDFEGSVKLGNLDLLVLKPVNIDISNKFGGTEIIYFCEPDAKFEIDNQFGNVDNDFLNSTGSKIVRIKNSFGNVEITKKTGG